MFECDMTPMMTADVLPMMMTLEGFAKASSKMWSEAGSWWEAGHLLSSSLH